MKSLIIIGSYLFLLLQYSQVLSQNITLHFDHITMEDGLSQSTVEGIVQDKYGFMWFGTQDGLNRYDGYDFKIFRHDYSKPSSISYSFITSLILDRNKNIWVGTGQGLNRYIYEKESFISYVHQEENINSLDHSYVSYVYESKRLNGVLWLATKKGLNRFDIKDEKFTRYSLPISDSTNQNYNLISTIYESDTNPGILWIGTNSGLYQFNTKSEKFNKYHYETKSDNLNQNIINTIFEDSYGKTWVGTDDGLIMIDKKNSGVIIFKNDPKNLGSLGYSNIKTIYEDNRKNLWIGTGGGGLNLFQREKKEFLRWESEPGNQNSIGGIDINTILEDNSGILWIGTAINGIEKVSINERKFIHYFYNPNTENSLVYNSVRAIYKDDDEKIWIGTDNGMSCLDRKLGVFTNFRSIPGSSNSLSDNALRDIYKDKNGIFWIGTRYGGLNRYDPETQSFTHYMTDINNPTSINSNNVKVIFEDNNGILWIGTVDGGLNKFDPVSGVFKHYLHDPNNTNSLLDNWVHAIIQDNKGFLWLGTSGGLVKLDTEKELFTHYIANRNDINSLNHHSVMSLYEDNDGLIWVATFGGGLNVLDPETGLFDHYTEKDGLSNNIVYGIVPDDNNNLWLSTNYGISKFNCITKEFTNFSTKDGVQSAEFNSGAYYRSKDGEIFFGGINGLNIINPESIDNNSVEPPILITDFQLFNKSVLVGEKINNNIILNKSILITDTLRLSYRDNVFSFSFTALDYYFSEKNEYSYILEGVEKEWNDVGNRRFVTYSTLPPGEYTFHVRGSNCDGIWNKEGKSIKIFISPPWWRTSIFYISIIALTTLLIFLYIRRRERKLKMEKFVLENKVNERTKDLTKSNKELKEKQEEIYTQNETLEQLNATKDKFFSIIAHDLINPFNIILGYSKLLKSSYYDLSDEKKKYFVDKIDKSSKNTFELLKNLLSWAGTQRGEISINKEKINLAELVNKSIKPLLSGAEFKKISININVSEDIFVKADRETMSTVLNNLISNAIKFTHRKGEITISARSETNHVVLFIKDSGVGMSIDMINNLFKIDKSHSTSGTEDEKGTGLGLLLVKEFIEKNGGTINVDSKPDEGSVFKITIPKA